MKPHRGIRKNKFDVDLSYIHLTAKFSMPMMEKSFHQGVSFKQKLNILSLFNHRCTYASFMLQSYFLSLRGNLWPAVFKCFHLLNMFSYEQAEVIS